MLFVNALVALATVTVVHAQNSTTSAAAGSTTGAPTISPCIIACVTPAALANNCTSFADVQCVCSSAQFQADAGLCLQTHCTADDVTAALALQTAQCGAAGVTPSGTAGPPRTVSFTSAAASSTGNATSTAKSTASGSATSTKPAGTSSTKPAGTSSTGTAPATSSSAAAQVVRVAWAGVALAGAAVGLAL